MPRVKFIGFKVKNYCQVQTLRQKMNTINTKAKQHQIQSKTQGQPPTTLN
jgi:hypothetical protein